MRSRKQEVAARPDMGEVLARLVRAFDGPVPVDPAHERGFPAGERALTECDRDQRAVVVMLGRVHADDDLAAPYVAHALGDHRGGERVSVAKHLGHVGVPVHHEGRWPAFDAGLLTQDRRLVPQPHEVGVGVSHVPREHVVEGVQRRITHSAARRANR